MKKLTNFYPDKPIEVKQRWVIQSKALFGIHYRSAIAILAGVNKRTVERWDKGEYPVRPEVVDKINKTYEIWRKDLKKGADK